MTSRGKRLVQDTSAGPIYGAGQRLMNALYTAGLSTQLAFHNQSED